MSELSPEVLKCLSIIDALRNSDHYIEFIYLRGGCYQLHLILKAIYPEALPYIHKDKDHIVTMLFGKLFDIRGIINKRKEGLYSPLQDSDVEMCKSWNFSNNNLLQVCECPHCEEPIVYEDILEQ